jgi:nitroimidazol reductase NimA-like FMN-containing flavoprotein (pyridoxamine 5'-phosphate oxidase superfamily)
MLISLLFLLGCVRRTEKEIKSKKEIEMILHKATICRVGFVDNNIPYIVPMYFGYKDSCLYFHSATLGRKIDLIRKNNVVCFEVDINHQITNTGVPCNWSSKYQSIIGYGKAFLIEDLHEKREALNVIIEHYSPGTTYQYPEEKVREIAIIKIKIESMTGKQST